MQCAWLGERVATADVSRVVSNVLHKREDAGWGPNAVFRFPKEGGTGAIWKGVARLLPPANCRLGPANRVVDVDLRDKTVTFKDGKKLQFGSLISTLPLDLLLRMPGVNRPDLADRLHYSSSHIIGIGIRGISPHGLKCWLYYPENNCPFYRCTVFSHYAEANCPGKGTKLPTLCRGDGTSPATSEAREGPYWSLMFEVSESAKFKPVDMTPKTLGGGAGTWPTVVLETLLGAINTKLIRADDEIVSIYHRRIQHG
jgi:protoporphyrinogen oxidase